MCNKAYQDRNEAFRLGSPYTTGQNRQNTKTPNTRPTKKRDQVSAPGSSWPSKSVSLHFMYRWPLLHVLPGMAHRFESTQVDWKVELLLCCMLNGQTSPLLGHAVSLEIHYQRALRCTVFASIPIQVDMAELMEQNVKLTHASLIQYAVWRRHPESLPVVNQKRIQSDHRITRIFRSR